MSLTSPLWGEGGLSAQLPAGRLLDRGDDLLRHRLDLGVGQRLLAWLERHLDGERLLALRHALSGEQVEHTHVANERAIGARSGAHHIAGLNLAVEQEGKVAPDRLEVGSLERLAGALALRGGDRVEIKLKARQRRIDAELGEKVGMKLPEHPEHGLRPEPERAGTAGVEP